MPSSIVSPIRTGALLLLASMVVGAQAGEPVSTTPKDSCLECHQLESHLITNKKIYDYHQRYSVSVHGLEQVVCVDCHGGDSATDDPDRAHVGVMERVSHRRIPETCGACHENELNSFRQSSHFQALEEDGNAPECVTCHGSMEVDVYYSSLVKNTCTICHNEEKDILPEVPAQAERVLSQINIIKGYRTFVGRYSKDTETLAEIDRSYSHLATSWHLFDLDQVEIEVEHLMGVLRVEKAKALRAKRGR